LWFHYKLAPQSVAYNLAGAITVPAGTDLEALRRAFQKVAARHPMLRTLFASQHGEPAQRVFPSVEVAFQVEDASQWDSMLNESHSRHPVRKHHQLLVTLLRVVVLDVHAKIVHAFHPLVHHETHR
jgi:hypothetical protein